MRATRNPGAGRVLVPTLVVALLGAVPATARQQTPEPNPATPQDPNPPADPATRTTSLKLPNLSVDVQEGGGEPAGPGPAASERTSMSEVRVTEYGTVDIIALNDDVTNVLQKLAIQARRNIVPSKSINQRVSATIYDAPLPVALEALLKPNGLDYIERQEFLFVYTQAEMAAMGERLFSSRVIHLDYVRAEDAKEFAAPLLSPEGKIEATRDLESDGGGGGSDEAAGGVVARDEGIYTPNVDEFALSNAVVVHDYTDNVKRVEKFLLELDQKPAQVLIEVTVVEAALTENNAFGIDFAMMSGVDFSQFFNFPVGEVPIGIKTNVDAGTGNLVSPNLPDGEAFGISSAGNAGAGPATFRAGGIIADQIGVFLRALDQVTDTTLLGNPKVLAVNRQVANLLVGTKVGYLETTVVENQVLQTVEFIDTGIALDIRPFILRDGRVRMEVMPKVSKVTFREVVGLSNLVQQIPDEEIQTITTNILLPQGHTAVIGGLFREDTVSSRNQVPVFGDIPFAGWAFRGQDEMTEKSEVIFLIRATVMDDDAVIEDGIKGSEYVERVRVGTRIGLLPWSRERQTSKLNLTAQRLADQGRLDAALWHLRRSLELYPQQPEVFRLYEQLATGPHWWPTRSLMERMIHDEHERSYGSTGHRGGIGAMPVHTMQMTPLDMGVVEVPSSASTPPASPVEPKPVEEVPVPSTHALPTPVLPPPALPTPAIEVPQPRATEARSDLPTDVREVSAGSGT